jgi:hypothetical protein
MPLSHLFDVGFDVFISYSHQGGRRYAEVLARHFTKNAYHPFFDGDYGRPEKLSIDLWLSRALRRSKILVLIGDPVAFTRPWVGWEVETFARGKPDAQLITISFGDAFPNNQQSGTLFPTLRDRIYLTEDAESLTTGQLSPAVVRQISDSQRFLRKIERRRRMLFLAVAAVIFAFVAGVYVGRTPFPVISRLPVVFARRCFSQNPLLFRQQIARANLRSASRSAVDGYPVSVKAEPIEEM